MARLTFEQVKEFADLIGWEAPATIRGGKQRGGAWQWRIIREICENRQTTVKAPRQNAGKSEAVSLYCAAALWNGLRVGIGMPTKEQGGRIVVDRTYQKMLKAEHICTLRDQDCPKISKPDAVHHKRWTLNSELYSEMISMSLYDAGDDFKGKGTQGYTFDVLVMDEAQDATQDVYERVEPTIDTAVADEEETIVFSGVGGFPQSLIEIKFDEPKTHNIWVKPAEMIAEQPDKYTPFFEGKQANVPDSSWRQNYLCERLFGAGGQLFPHLPESVLLGPNRHMEFGIDVGRSQDYTIVHAIETDGIAANVLETLQISGLGFPQQANRVAEFINRYMYLPHHVRVEKNTIGYGLWDSLVLLPGFENISAVFTSDSPPYFSKSTWIHELMLKARNGKLGVASERHRKELMNLMFEQNESGVYDWPHNDLLAGLWVWQARNHSVYAI